MKFTEHQLKEIYKGNANRQRNADCPSAEELFQLLSTSLDSQSRAKIASHLEVCADCTEEFKMAHELSENVVKSAPRRSYWGPILAAATIILALAAGIISKWTPTYVPDPVERGEQPVEFKTQPSNGEQLDSIPEKLEWSAVPGVQNYRVKLLNYSSKLIVDSGPISSTKYSLPDEIRNQIQPGQIYYWRIEYEKGGEQESKLFRFSIR